MKIKIIFILVLMGFPIKSNAIAWTDWGAETPGGNTISDNWGPKTLIVKDSFILRNLEEWYFYRSRIIGKYSSGHGSYNWKYFIYNEANSTLDTFDNVVDWSNQLHQKKLIPDIWTRWYSRDWDSISVQDILIIGFIFISFGIALSIKIFRNFFKIQHPLTLFIYGIILMLVLMKWKLTFPGSF